MFEWCLVGVRLYVVCIEMNALTQFALKKKKRKKKDCQLAT